MSEIEPIAEYTIHIFQVPREPAWPEKLWGLWRAEVCSSDGLLVRYGITRDGAVAEGQALVRKYFP